MKDRTRNQLLGLGLLALALFVTLSLIPVSGFAPETFPDGSIMGVLGRVVADTGVRALGVGVLMLPILLAIAGAASWGWLEGGRGARYAALVCGLLVLLPSFAALASGAQDETGASMISAAAAGWIGNTIAVPLMALLSSTGAFLLLLVLTIALSIATIGWNPVAAGVRAVRGVVARLRRPRLPAGAVVFESVADDERVEPFAASDNGSAPIGVTPARPARRRDEVLPDPAPRDSAALANLPSLTILAEPPARDAAVAEGELDRLGEVLIRTLQTFKVEGRIAGRTTGPVVTQFEVEPAPGVKVNRIASLDADLALALRAPSIRIVAPIPGKGAVGVEVPNPEPEVVYLKRILEAPGFQRARADLPLALGRDLTGKPYVADLVRMPHLLIAGATGSGKSVCINALITSLVFRHTPQSLRLLLIDPKMVELSMYGDLPHLRHPVVKNPHDAARVLKWAVLEMERRYELLSANTLRSITEFNRRLGEGQSMRLASPDGPEEEPASWHYRDGPLPYIVLIVDELADLMMTVQAEIERPLAQLAQKARAIGVHLIVATQRPSVNVITGLIKANFPCRIAFRVASKVDSRTILDQNGADALLGNGDLLFLPPGASDPVRIQGAFISTDDTERLMEWYRAAAIAKPPIEDDIIEVIRARELAEGEQEELDLPDERDALFRQAAEICIRHQQGSTSLLQRKLRVGYGRAARIIDQLHTAGILGPPDGSKPREVLVGLDFLDDEN
ncbi:MAG: DNA translocase FtsK [Gemmatimonadetes bacterium]|nr:DNA translocase FtsK [Gemmatimonadota bacterium]